jgi:hypothetical protein
MQSTDHLAPPLAGRLACPENANTASSLPASSDPPDLQRLSRAIINIAKRKTDDTPIGNDSQTGTPYLPEQPDP